MLFLVILLSAVVAATVTWFTMWLVLHMEETQNGRITAIGTRRRELNKDSCEHLWSPWNTVSEDFRGENIKIIQQRDCELCKKQDLTLIQQAM